MSTPTYIKEAAERPIKSKPRTARAAKIHPKIQDVKPYCAIDLYDRRILEWSSRLTEKEVRRVMKKWAWTTESYQIIPVTISYRKKKGNKCDLH